MKDNKYTIEYDDGETEKGVAEEMIRALEKEDEPPAKRDASPEREASKFAAGDAVEARFGGKKEVVRGKILKVLDGARYEVEYDDGDVEKGVAEEMIRALAAAPAPAAAAGAYAVGAKVECSYKGKKRYYPGIIAAYEDGTYAIDYDDGEKESGVAEELIKYSRRHQHPPGRAERQIRRRRQGRGALPRQEEVVRRRGHEGNDGDLRLDHLRGRRVEDGVAEELIRAVEEQWRPRPPRRPTRTASTRWARRSNVGIRAKNATTRAASLATAAANTTSTTTTARRSLGWPRSSFEPSRRHPAPAAAADATRCFEAGTQVLARYKGKKKWYPGTVMKRNDDGTYEIMYDDGDKGVGSFCGLRQGPRGNRPKPANARRATGGPRRHQRQPRELCEGVREG